MSADVEYYTLAYLMPPHCFCKGLSYLNLLTFAQLEILSTENQQEITLKK